ncbi:MAG: hypothetical protein IJ498_09385 [Akkermansia sp.]|nr:hypothetical protein [Akkermansia sp.]
MRKLLLLSLLSGITAFAGICVAEWLTFDTYAAEVESRGITHATLVEKATIPELVVVSLPWALALAMLAQWLIFTPQSRLLRNLSRWLALISPLMALEGLFLHEDILRTMLHMGGPFNFPHALFCCIILTAPLALGTLIPFVLFSFLPTSSCKH